MKTWQSQGINGSASKYRDVWIYTGIMTINQWKKVMINSANRDKLFLDRTDWTRNGHYEFTGWQLIRNDQIGIYNNVLEDDFNFYTQDWQYKLGNPRVLQGYDADTHLFFPGFTQGHCYFLCRIFRYIQGQIDTSDRMDMTPIFFDTTTMEQDTHNANMMNFLWKYRVPGYNLTAGNAQYRHRNHYYAYTKGIDPDTEDNNIEGGAFPQAKPNLNKIITNYPYPEVPSGVQQLLTTSLRQQAVVFGNTYTINYNTIWFPYWRIILPLNARENAIVRRGFNKWLFDIGKEDDISIQGSNYRYCISGFLILGR